MLSSTRPLSESDMISEYEFLTLDRVHELDEIYYYYYYHYHGTLRSRAGLCGNMVVKNPGYVIGSAGLMCQLPQLARARCVYS